MKDGFFGGTFDPPHLGHLALAQEALEKYSLEKVFFVPTHIPPHKTTCPVTEFSHRIQMIELAIAGNPCFQVANLDSEGVPSYTVDMLQRLSNDGVTPWFIIGMDSLQEMHTWKQPLRILDLARVVAGTRPGFNSLSVDPEILKRVSLFEFPGVWISSSELRTRVRTGRRISYLVPGNVESYIRSRGLYGAAESY